jgi:RNA polymerase sigma factor (sigma-70 family)
MTERLAPVVERLEILPVREREFIERYYINGETYREIAETAGVCHQRVRQIIVHGLARLRKEVKYDRL